MHGFMYFGPGKQASAAPYTDCCCTHDECVRLLQHVVSAKCVKVLLHSRKMRPSVGETNDGGKKGHDAEGNGGKSDGGAELEGEDGMRKSR